MRALISAGLLFVLTPPAAGADEGTISLHTGHGAQVQGMLWDPPGDGLVYRFRFVSPSFTGDEDFELQAIDLEYLCTAYAMPRLADIGPMPSRIVISLADRASEFGQFDPDVAQVFESFSPQGERCIWEMH